MTKEVGSKTNENWFKPSSEEPINYNDVIVNVTKFMKPEVNGVPVTYKAYVGTDAQRKGSQIKMITSIAIRRFDSSGCGNGGIYFYTKEYFNYMLNLRLKLITEAGQTLLIAYKLKEDFDKLGINIPIEIHFDVSITGDSNIARSQIESMARGSQFDWKIKPFAWCASKVADKYSK